MDVSDGIDKSWDHPWTTEEMRKKRREWSLAGDVGLLKHLQQFSENLVSKANRTQTALDTLATQLKETGILVDNVTNTSLALANTQFIESRVQEDDIELKSNSEEKQEIKLQDSAPENLIANISESVKQGLNIMDEKYKIMNVSCSDSEEEDDGGAVVFSVIVRPNDPYQDRPLPYVIGSDKWMASDKIGLENSSSESEQADEEDKEESESDEEENIHMQKVLNGRHNPEINIARLSSSSDSDNYNDPDSNTPYMSNKTDTASQNINSASESVTPNILKTSETAPNFAEELAKRLGSVRQTQKPTTIDEASESSINRFKDDLFASEKNSDLFNDSSDNLFNDEKGFFNNQVSANLWKDKPIRSYKNSNIIPPSIDVPPPISIVSTKPKSEIDDLFADADSEEDSDIFSSRKTIKTRTKEPNASDNTYSPANVEEIPKKFLDAITPEIAGVAINTSETKVNFPNLFSDDENDDADLFGNRKKQSSTFTSTPSSTTQEFNRKKLAGEVSIFGNALTSDIKNKLSSRIMQQRQASSESSDSDAPENSDNATTSNAIPVIRGILDDIDRNSQISSTENLVQDISRKNINSNSGISVPPSIDDAIGSSLRIQPNMCSREPKSEEIYRERITSDNLFTQTRDPAISINDNSNNQQHQQQQEQQNISSMLLQDDIFENDLFGPPPLSSKTDLKRTVKSKVSSLFDDSDSGDELFSAASSGSRSQKSTEFFAATSSNDKTKPKDSGPLFDDNDLFGGKDAPEVNIFSAVSKSKRTQDDSDGLFGERGQNSIASTYNINKSQQNIKIESKKISLFDDDDDGDLFSTKPSKSKIERKSDLFEDENNLFLSAKASKQHTSVEKDVSTELKIDVSKNISIETEKKRKDDSSENKSFSEITKTRSLLFEDDDYDDLFGKKVASIYEDDRSKSESKEKVKKNTIEEIQKLPEENKNPIGFSGINHITTAISESNVMVNDVSDKRSKTDVEESFNVEENEGVMKKNLPPRTLNIRTTTLPSTEEQSNQQQVPRRLVSGKIKNLMGKMGDLKILSPMDAPPLWRKSEDKTDDDEDAVDSDGGSRTAGHISPPSISEDNARKESSYSTISAISNAEAAISFDDPTQVETLSTTASKSRVRIQAKRRPQSRHARKSALRYSGIDFDTVDNIQDNSQEESHASISSSTKDSVTAPVSAADHLTVNDNTHRSTVDPSSIDDKSELGSISKESSMSVNKNTLLSPSTDEEDLFDVPPDLPEDPQKEDTLFGRAPILSPIDGEYSDETLITTESFMDSTIKKIEDENNLSILNDKDNKLMQSDIITKSELKSHEKRNETREQIDNEWSEAKKESSAEKPNDPLRDSSHDPLKDPSPLFAFVTKTPSPETSKGLLFSEPDDSLFSSNMIKNSNKIQKKDTLDLFADDDIGGDLFSSVQSKKTVKKSLRDTKIGLFCDNDGVPDDEDDSLFGSTSSKTKLTKQDDNQKSNLIPIGRKKNNIFDDNDDDDSSLFVESSNQSQKSDSISFSESKPDPTDHQTKSSNLKSIFGDTSCHDDDDDLDLFATKKVIPKNITATSKSLFASDDEDNGDYIFAKQPIVSKDPKPKTVTITNSRPAMKKSITRDLKKTAEKIVEDPLSLLQDD